MHVRTTGALGAVAVSGTLAALGLAGAGPASAGAAAAHQARPVTAYVASLDGGTITQIGRAHV